MFEEGDIIKHKRENKVFLVVQKETSLGIYEEKISFTVLDLLDNKEIKLHHPLMTCYYEKVA